MKFAGTVIALMFMLSIATAVAAVPPVFQNSWGSMGSGDGEFNFPTGIAIDGSGRIHVADFGNSRIQTFDGEGSFLLSWGRSGSGDGEFDQPQGLAVGPGGLIYVADVFNNRIEAFSSDSSFSFSWGVQGSGDGEFNTPRDVAVGLDGSVYVADAGNHRIQRFAPQGGFLGEWGSFGSAIGEFNSPQHLTVGPEGNVFVSDAFNHRVQKFDSTGVFLFSFGENGSGDGQFINPRDLAVDSGGNVYVADLGNNRIQIFDATGDLLGILGGKPAGSGDGEFTFPEAVAVDGRGTVYVVDSGNYRIQEFVPMPLIDAIADVTNDQGGQVRITLTGSSQDAPSPVVPILQYEVFRRIGADPEKSDQNRRDVPPTWAGNALSDQSALLTGWEFVGAIPAHAEDEYSIVVPTLADSTIEYGARYTFFFVRAATANPAVFFDSPVDSGYSVDNLEPNVPVDFAIGGVSPDGDVTLRWSPSGAADFRYYSVYRGMERDFEPAEGNLVVQTTATGYVDEGAAPSGLLQYYKLSATDFSGNESDFALASTGVVAIQPGDGMPSVFALHAAAPNPIRNSSTVGFDLPVATKVTLRFYDARGRVVRGAFAGAVFPAGRHQWVWDRRDESGRRVPPGMYFYTLVSPRFSETRKIVVVD